MSLQPNALIREDIHLLVIDDDDRIRDLLKRYLTRQGYRVSAAENAIAARRFLSSLTFDCLILDIMMPGEDGLELTASLRQQNDVPIILLTAKGEPSERIEGLKSGADDYLAKPFEPEELVLRIESILRRASKSTPTNQLLFGPFRFDLDRQELQQGDTPVRLTTGEAALLMTLGRRPGTAIARHVLAEAIGAKSERAVDVQMTRLRRKIEAVPAEPDYLITVRGQGYRLMTDTL